MERGKMSSTGRGGKSKGPQHPQDIFALGSKSTVVVSRDSEKRNIHKPTTSGVERKREGTSFGAPPPGKRSRIGSPAESVTLTSLEVDPVDLVPHVLQALDTHNSDKLLGLLTGSIRLLKSQRAKPDPILCMSMLYLCKIRPNMFAHEAVTQSLCSLLKREQGAAFKNKGNPLVFVLACNMLYAGHRENKNWPDTFIKVYIEDALNERWWVECSWCKCLVENIVTAFNTKLPPSHLIPSDNTLGTMSPSGSGSPLMGSTDEDTDNTELEYTVFPRYSTSYESVEGLVLEAIKDQIQRRAQPDAIGKGFLKLLSATCGFPEIRMIAASRLEAWLHSGKLWRAAQELLAFVCCNADACGPTAARDHEVLAQLARMRLKTKPLQAAYVNCLREMVSESPALLRSVVTHTIYNELSNVRSPNNLAVLGALVQAQPLLVPQAMADTYQELLLRPEEYLRPLRALTRECVRTARSDASALLPLARALAQPPPHDPSAEVRERAFSSLADLFALCCLLTASHSKHWPQYKQQICGIQTAAVNWLLECIPIYHCSRHEYQLALNKIMFVEPIETYTRVDNWPPESERAATYRLCTEAPLPQSTLLSLIFIGLSKEIPVSPAEVFELIESLVRRACALPPEDNPLQVDKLELADYLFQLCQFHPPDNIALPAGYTPPPLAITSLYWRGWVLLTLIAAHNPQFAERATATYPTLRALTEFCVTGKASIEWSASTAAEAEAERAAVLQLETHLAAASNSKLPVTEHNCRLLTQLTTLEPLGPARRPPAAVLESLQALNTARGLGRLLCRAGSLLVQLVQRHTVRRAMPWLHHLLQRDHLQLSVLPVQCLCEFLSAGAAGVGGGEPGKAGELAAHLRRTIADSAQGARAVLHYYMQRLSHSHAQTRSSAGRGLKLVLTQAEDAVDIDYNAEVSPDEWLDLLWVIPHWELVKEEVVSRIRAACLVECLPRHLAAYIAFLARHMAQEPDVDHTDLILDISQMLMERMCVMGNVLPPAELRETRPAEGEGPLGPQRTLHAITSMLFMHIQQVRNGAADEEGAGGGAVSWGAGERVALQWGTRPRVTLHAIVAHAHLKLLCYGPSIYDTNQEMYNWLLSIWVGDEAPQAFLLETEEEAALLPDWLRLHLVRSARAPLLAAGLRGLSAHTLALFIQTFGLPPQSITALLGALDACPAGAVNRVGVERGYMWQLLRVQRARGARGGGAFAAALQLQPPQHPPPDELFITKPLPVEMEGSWCFAPAQPSLALEQVAPLVSAAFGVATNFSGDLDTSLTQLTQKIVEEANHILSGRSQSSPYTHQTVTYLFSQLSWIGAAMLRNEARAAALCRALSPHSLLPRGHMLKQFAETLLKQYKCCMSPLVSILRDIANIDPAKERSKTKDASRTSEPMVVDQEREDRVEVPSHASKDQLVALLESSTPNSLEELGNRIIESQDTRLVVDVISHILEKNQAGGYDVQIKTEEGAAAMSPHVFARASLGCGLLLDWMSQLQQETLAAQPHRQMRLMFRSGTAPWRPLLATLLAHRASWRTLHACLTALLETDGSWAATSVLDFAETLVRSPRVWQGRDKGTPKHHKPEDSLRLSHRQLRVLVRYILEEARDANANGGSEAMRRGIEARLPLLLQCCPDDAALLCAALTASDVHGTSPHHDMLLLLLYMKVPKTLRLIANSSLRPCSALTLPAQSVASSTSATDRVSHALLTALADTHQKDKLVRIEAGVRSLWSRHSAAGARALPLVAALLRGLPARSAAVTHLLAAVEMVPDAALFSDENTKDLHDIIECLLNMGAGGPSAGGSGVGALMHRLAAILRRYLASNLQRATAVLHQHWGIVATIPALSSLSLSGAGESGAPSSSLPPPQALQVLQRRSEDPTEMNWPLQELEAWGLRRGGAWGGRDATRDVLRAAAPLLSAPPPPPRDHVRKAARGLLVKILPAVEDTRPGFEAVMECLESGQPELVHSVLDKLAELVCGMMEHAPALLNTVFRLGVTSRYPVEASIAKCVATINLQRGC